MLAALIPYRGRPPPPGRHHRHQAGHRSEDTGATGPSPGRHPRGHHQPGSTWTTRHATTRSSATRSTSRQDRQPATTPATTPPAGHRTRETIATGHDAPQRRLEPLRGSGRQQVHRRRSPHGDPRPPSGPDRLSRRRRSPGPRVSQPDPGGHPPATRPPRRRRSPGPPGPVETMETLS